MLAQLLALGVGGVGICQIFEKESTIPPSFNVLLTNTEKPIRFSNPVKLLGIGVLPKV